MAIPAWAPLLQVYGGFLLPVVFTMLIAMNMIIWKRFRINYVFIFGEFGLYVLSGCYLTFWPAYHRV